MQIATIVQTPPVESKELAKRFAECRAQTERLATPLSPEDCQAQSMPDASPIKWHLAHTTWFFETFILERFEPLIGRNFTPHHPAFRVLFNSYYNGVGDKHPRPQRGLVTRPSLQEVKNYRAAVNQRLNTLLEAQRSLNEDDQQVLNDLVTLGINHEQQHQELILTDLKHLLSMNPLHPVYAPSWPLVTVKPEACEWIAYEAGLHSVGHEASIDRFAFDNESPKHQTYLNAFELATHPVTYGEFAAFVNAGGYQRHELWLSLGWDWIQRERIDKPMYWHQSERGWQTFTLHGLVDIEPNTPVAHISYFEADAYARWVGARLPTEAEWEVAAQASLKASGGAVIDAGNFVADNALHPLAARTARLPQCHQHLFGDVWEWTQSSYAPYPGFKAAEGAVGEYNGKFMCNQYVLRGGSCVTPRDHIRASYRNFFPPEARWQFSGLRLARDIQ
jgi:ergothioneine biosynthesis protein EgtB